MFKSDVQQFGDLLKQCRKKLDLTQDQLADCAGCSPATIRLIEHGQRRPSRQIAELLAGCLRVPQAEVADFLALARGMHLPSDGGDPARPAPVVEEEQPIPSNLPAQLMALIGRDEELADIEALLLRDHVHLVTLTGPPGVGKTSLALHVAGALARYQPAGEGGSAQLRDGIFWVALASVTQPEMVIPTISRVFEVQNLGGVTVFAALKQHLARKRLLLLLDNFEQVIQATSQLVELLYACPHLKVLVTSRESLNVRVEQEFSVQPLSLSNVDDLPSMDSPAASPAVALFVKRAQAADAHFALNRENAPLVAAICARLDGLPLAIELVAARTRMLPVKALLARLQYVSSQPTHLDLLSGGARDFPGRHKTLRDAINWSYSLLSGEEQLLFRRLGVFLGGFSLPAAEAICNAASDLNLSLFEGISQLLNKSLLKREIAREDHRNDHEQVSGGRFTMLETIREYAAELLKASGEEHIVRLLHAEYLLALSSRPDFYLSGAAESDIFQQLDPNIDNLRAALRWTLEHDRLDLAAQFGVSLPRYWETRGYFAEGRDWLLRVLSAQARSAELSADALQKRTTMLLLAGRMSMYLCDLSDAHALLDQALALASEFDLEALVHSANQQIGQVEWQQGNYASARYRFETGLRSVQATGSMSRKANLHWMLGIIESESGYFERAESLLTTARTEAAEGGDVYAEMGATRDMGTALCYEGRYTQAVPLLEEALSIARSARFEVGTSWTYFALGLAMIGLGNHDQGEAYLRESLARSRTIEKYRIPDSLEGLAEIEVARANAGKDGLHMHLQRSAILLGAAEATRSILNASILPVRAPVRERLISETQTRLDAREFEQAYAAGQKLSIEEAISCGLGALPEIEY